eukprot:7297082-Heterocapsa_arctica.AAC.1
MNFLCRAGADPESQSLHGNREPICYSELYTAMYCSIASTQTPGMLQDIVQSATWRADKPGLS